jgi:hypothetical protein
MGSSPSGRPPASPVWWPIKGLAFVAARPAAFRRFWQAAALYAAVSAATLALAFSLLFEPQHQLLVGLLGHTWLAWQVASGAVLAEASWPLFLLLQFRQGDLTNGLFVDVLKEVGVAEPAPLSVPERDELQAAAAARRRARAAKLTGAAAPCTAPAQLLGDLVNGRPGESAARAWARLTLSAPLLLFWPYGPAAYALLNGYATGVSHHIVYYKAKGISDRDEQESVAASRAPQYRRFGTAAMLLSLVPVVGWGLSVISAAGAALWAAELEGAGGRGPPAKLYLGGTKTHDGAEYSSVAMADLEEGRLS